MSPNHHANSGVVVLGSGRSGTSLVAGLIDATGAYHLGDRLLPPSELNPAGFFEDLEVNRVNEQLLSQHTPNYRRSLRRLPGYGRGRRRYRYGQRWLCDLEPSVRFRVGPRLKDQMHSAIPPAPFCVKDPRFCYTLDAWTHVLGAHSTVCVFRKPGETIASVLTAIDFDEDLRSIALSAEEVEAIWCSTYRAAIARSRTHRPWMFVDYADLIEGPAVNRLAEFLRVDLDIGFVDSDLRRSPERKVGAEAAELYGDLTRRSVARSKA